MADLERPDSHDEGFVESRDDVPLKESAGDAGLVHEGQDYPSTLQLIPILIGLCLQSICIALVGGLLLDSPTLHR